MSEQCAIWLDGVPATSMPLPDRGLDFGDGLFETILLHRGTPLYLEQHLLRLLRGLKALAIPDCLGAVREQLAGVAQALQNTGWQWAALRVTVTRGGGPRGYLPPITPSPRVLLQASALDRDCAHLVSSASLAVAALRLSSQPALAGIKHLNRLEQVLAAAEGREQGVDEVLLLDAADNLVSVAAGNIFVVTQGELLTPPLSACGVAGTRRSLVIDRWAPAAGLRVREEPLILAQIQAAEEVFYSNALYTLRPVSSLGERRWHQHPVCEALFKQFQESLQ